MLGLEECLHPAMRLPSPTQLNVYCVLQIHCLMFGGEFVGCNIAHSTVSRDAQKFSINFCVITILYYISDTHNYMDVLDSNLQ